MMKRAPRSKAQIEAEENALIKNARLAPGTVTGLLNTAAAAVAHLGATDNVKPKQAKHRTFNVAGTISGRFPSSAEGP